MSRLARANRVLFVEPAPYLRETVANLRTRGADAIRDADIYSPLDNLWVYSHPTFAPISGRRPFKEMTFAWRVRSLRKTMRQLRLDNPILWIFQYNLGEMIGHLDEKLIIYHAVDEYSAYVMEDDGRLDERRRRVRELETDVMRRSDLVFVTSPALLESKSRLHPHVVLVPNGVDYESFAVRPMHNGVAPPDIESLPRPLVGYAGVINEKLDLPLLSEVARAQPNWHFLFVGPIALRRETGSLAALRSRPNVHFIGPRTVAQLPAYIWACDVCLIPYRKNEWTRNISPLKLYEYLAAGKPIVSTDIPAAREFADVIWLASDADAFRRAIGEALDASSDDLRRREQAIAREHTWERRVEALSAAIEQRLKTITNQQSRNNG